MKTTVNVLFIFIVLWTSTVFAATGDILSSFPAPSAGTTGTAFDGTYLWIIDTLNREFVQLTVTGTVNATFPIPVGIDTPVDLAFDGTDLWVTDKTSDKVFQVSTTGTILFSFDCPCTQPMGITFDGTDLWIGSERDRTMQVSVSGSLIKTIDSPVTVPQGLTYANGLLWVSGLADTDIHATTIYSGMSVYSFPEPDGNTQGLAFDGTNLWATGSVTDTIYELELNPIMVIPIFSYTRLLVLTFILAVNMIIFLRKWFIQ